MMIFIIPTYCAYQRCFRMILPGFIGKFAIRLKLCDIISLPNHIHFQVCCPGCL